jgi:Flp pilus assembly pilin Flp
MLKRLPAEICRDQNGQDMVEYALLAAFIATAALVALPPGLIESIRELYLRISDYIAAVAIRI